MPVSTSPILQFTDQGGILTFKSRYLSNISKAIDMESSNGPVQNKDLLKVSLSWMPLRTFVRRMSK